MGIFIQVKVKIALSSPSSHQAARRSVDERRLTNLTMPRNGIRLEMELCSFAGGDEKGEDEQLESFRRNGEKTKPTTV